MKSFNRTFFFTKVIIILSLVSCQNNSNELVPIYNVKSFKKFFSLHGTVVGQATLSQTIKPGDDNLTLTLQNIGQETFLAGSSILFWIKNPEEVEKPFQWVRTIELKENLEKNEQMKPEELFTYPELPLNVDEVQVIPLSIKNQSNDSVTGLYTKAIVFSKFDAEYQNMGMVQGYINADGELYFQYQQGDKTRKLTGQLVHSLSLKNGNLQDGDKNYFLTLVKESSTVNENTIELVFDVSPLQEEIETQIKLFIQK